MRPSEFVSRIIDLFTFNMGDAWKDFRPATFTSAALAISLSVNQDTRITSRNRITDGDLASSRKHYGKCQYLKLNGYEYMLDTDTAIDHTIIKASMFHNNYSFGASICFTSVNFITYQGIIPQLSNNSADLLESWNIPLSYLDRVEEVVSMLAYLTLKTDHKIKMKV